MAREMAMPSEEALKYVWGGAVPLQIHLHESEVTTLPPPPPALILGPRIGYLPLLIPLIKPHFESALPPGVDTVWFEYKGLPLKWYIPTGVLFDILCAEPERPWNLTVHFRGYPSELLTPCEGEDSVKWSFINFLKEAAYIINGNCKNVMNMSQANQLELWQSVVKGNMEGYLRVSSRLKLGPVGEDCLLRRTLNLQAGTSEAHSSNQTGRIPVRLYVRYVSKEFELEDATAVATWDNISYINRPVEIHNEEGKNHTLQTAMESLLPNFFHDRPVLDDQTFSIKEEVLEVDAGSEAPETESDNKVGIDGSQTTAHHELNSTDKPQVKLIRIQGFEPGLDLPLAWIVNNLSNPDYFLHVCVYISSDNACHQGNSALV